MGEDQLDDLQLDEPMGLGAQDVLGGTKLLPKNDFIQSNRF